MDSPPPAPPPPPPADKIEKEVEEEEEKEKEVESDDDFAVDEELLKDEMIDMDETTKKEKRERSLQLKEDGNAVFREGHMKEAAKCYTAALRECPMCFPRDRAVLYSNRAAAMAKMGLKKEAIKGCTQAIELDERYTKAVLRRANLNQETDQLDEALKDFQHVLELEPSNAQAQEAVRRLPDMITERNEKLKEEMMGKLKDLGNMFLRPFGLSTSNFELKQDASSGGYNISFKQNPNDSSP